MFHVDPAPSYHLDHAPLAQALAQVRYPVIAVIESVSGIAPLQEALRARFPYMEQKEVHEVSLLIGPSGPGAPQAASSKTWELTDDHGFRLVVSPSITTLSAGESYDGIENFAKVFHQVVEALHKVLGISRCDRLGVRYLSIAEDDPGAQGSWTNWFRPELLGLVRVLEPSALRTSITQTQLRSRATDEFAEFPRAVQAIVRHGFAPRGSDLPGVPPIKLDGDAFFLDLDLFSAGEQPFDAARIMTQFLMLHAQIDRFFYWALSDDGKRHFGLELRGD